MAKELRIHEIPGSFRMIADRADHVGPIKAAAAAAVVVLEIVV